MRLTAGTLPRRLWRAGRLQRRLEHVTLHTGGGRSREGSRRRLFTDSAAAGSPPLLLQLLLLLLHLLSHRLPAQLLLHRVLQRRRRQVLRWDHLNDQWKAAEDSRAAVDPLRQADALAAELAEEGVGEVVAVLVKQVVVFATPAQAQVTELREGKNIWQNSNKAMMITNHFDHLRQRPTGGAHGQRLEEGEDAVDVAERLEIARLLHAKDARQVVLVAAVGPLIAVHLHAGVEDAETVLNVHVDHLQRVHVHLHLESGRRWWWWLRCRRLSSDLQ